MSNQTNKDIHSLDKLEEVEVISFSLSHPKDLLSLLILGLDVNVWPFRSLMPCKDTRRSAYPCYKSDVTTCECPEGSEWHSSERLSGMKTDTCCLVKDRDLARVRCPFLLVSSNRPSFHPGRGPQIGGEPKMPLKLMTVRMGIFPELIRAGCKVKRALGEGKPERRFKNKRTDMRVTRTTTYSGECPLHTAWPSKQMWSFSQMKRDVTNPGHLLGVVGNEIIVREACERWVSSSHPAFYSKSSVNSSE